MSLVVISHEDADSLELLEAVSQDLAGSCSVVLVGGSVVLDTSVHVSESTDTDLRSEVHLSGEGGWLSCEPTNSDVVPVRIVRSDFLQVTGLDDVAVLGHKLLPLEV